MYNEIIKLKVWKFYLFAKNVWNELKILGVKKVGRVLTMEDSQAARTEVFRDQKDWKDIRNVSRAIKIAISNIWNLWV